MAEPRLSLEQKNVQIQTMKLSQQQIMAMNLIAMGSLELREEILEKVDENPALEIKEDKFLGNTNSVHTGKTSRAGEEAAEKYQNMLESAPDETETLQEHLLHQLNMINLPENEHRICKKLIENLDENGFFILAPVTLLEPEKGDNENLLKKCIFTVQHFDPEGICCQNVTESLEIQAKLKKDAPKIALYILHGRLEMLKPPIAEKVFNKIEKNIEENEKLSFWTQKADDIQLTKNDLSLENVKKSIEFIQNLEPFPAAGFKSTQEHFVQPDVYVAKAENSENLKVVLSNQAIPVLKIAEDFKNEENSNLLSEKNKKTVKMQLKDAQIFLDTLNFREQVLLNAFRKLAEIQKDFFLNGPGHLAPLTQREFAKMINVHESTVSRIAESKFLRCEWGTFPIKYFFTKALASTKTKNEENEETKSVAENISTDSVKIEIEKLLKTQKPGEKKLSDQKIADILAEKGIKIARRTVSKYRTQLNIASSYER
ncbi:MAG: RNA polymerase factor sigma-54 [Treponema sp.]|nr:RNA polymerase factor sigma-54 [Treponema sp.]